MASSLPPLVSQLCDLLHNPVLPAQLASAIQGNSSGNEQDIFLRIDASITTNAPSDSHSGSLPLGCINLRTGTLVPLQALTPAHTPDPRDEEADTTRSDYTSHFAPEEHGLGPSKRHKTVSGLRLPSHSSTGNTKLGIIPNGETSNDDSQDAAPKSSRQVHSDTRFPQRAKRDQGLEPPVLEPTSSDKLIAGIWRQIYSSVQLSREFSSITPTINIRSGASLEVFQSVNSLCLHYYNRSQSSRALEMIVQAFWVESFEARTAVLQYEKPILSRTEARMIAIREACVVLNWKEKDLRNRMAIWRGYKEIKDYGGWAALVFASAGVYRFCKYRNEFGEGLFSRLRHIRSSLEVAADTLHPGWRDLLKVIQQETLPAYRGHPHEWVIMPDGPALPLRDTYRHLNLPTGLQYKFIDECVLDKDVFGDMDPRKVPELDEDTCPICHEKQSDEIKENQCMCFPALFGGIRAPVPVQIFRTTSGKNNGVVARCSFDRGTAIGEFTGFITSGITGVDVMIGGSKARPYQIFQGGMGNFTRFINHSCRPNSQFQRFYWRGKERIIVVSRGVPAGAEITVDYSEGYWRELEKSCLCGEACCRFRGANTL
ncbi:hypothetical protein AN0219.2 [Aspergillus nidulans FGSC A4]|uniref:SET domain protein (AFU_orthologue AFUA_4G09180) n=1 Tax=Emericella nidulans (strain FGSC A4 / ATCC 38163 / CBS 112.46 / NRRL 194 / M139) TaxID=227321 RepID=Q5BGW1_EMENI|nr:hypothetical protein [Aspergillus nidulans FGSC A4]EAA66092.1 hypothetical protein AN0219.2 [Aspergillus nidulans FGSC A4]CBF89950.1 TPA: SET domain protein (AFU_orthologue; AFUA_4G09180) [Aspergillus nidulans FGSC A4]|eukprot:XP_657823.1 hypothetical protein AN0219.2 [Aspergillus nidulans FGSC A4]